MIILKVKKQKRLQNNFSKILQNNICLEIKMKNALILSFLLCTISFYSQNFIKKIKNPYKIGIHYNLGNEKDFLFDDLDYYYQSHTFKVQLFYPLKRLKSFTIDFAIQPQIQFIKHQLLNIQFVTPDEEDYEAKRRRFTQLKNMSLLGIETALHFQKKIFENIGVYLQLGLGFSYIDTGTERLAKGFTFIENANLGFHIKISTHTAIHMQVGLGHVSNLNFQLPNSGYNILNSGISLIYDIK